MDHRALACIDDGGSTSMCAEINLTELATES